MQDQPTASELVEAVADFIRNHAMPQLQGHAAFHARVAANALDIVKRELEVAPTANPDERRRLTDLLGHDGPLEELNSELCARIEAGEIGLDTPGLADHLWKTTLTKLAIDQPNYSGYRRALEESR
ncbi:DUF6285 domain-containing protein [Parvibaculum sp.]|uniref:DUF6285 domain-containing protein n=1 Tax=Parvibaculum sp. TaxID=2024848 RepID=UPI0027318CC3|nr:DUF6285 domain-containing protein [Parvibaculum sp.]MDP1628071.1 DUF6285 domain-containing protein [Parvibaculum sp.]MDP2151070.1 DUF6285 domain-containing protein [Parvibaculum sp.]MDP3328537.1 DUF6285 domain-containing protein [Parvibaculum sp.]